MSDLSKRLRDPVQYVDACDEAARLLDTLTDKAMSFTGHSDDILEALDQWTQERTAMIDFHEQVKVLTKFSRLDGDIIKAAHRIVKLIIDSGLPLCPPSLTPMLINSIDKFKEAVRAEQKARDRRIQETAEQDETTG